MQWLQDQNQSNVDNLNHVRRETRKHFRAKKDEYLRAKIDEIETKSKISYVNKKILYNEKRNGLYSSPNIIRVIKSRR